MGSAHLVVDSLVVGFRGMPVVRGISFEAPPGQLTLIIGPNGAGKSTLLKSITGVLRPWGGRVRINNRDITGLPSHLLLKEGVCFVPQGRVVFPFLTVDENLRLSGFTLRDPVLLRQRLEEVYAFFPSLAAQRGQVANKLSGGQQAMLALAKAWILHPELLILDEPSLGLAPKTALETYRYIKAARDKGVTLLVVEQNIRLGLSVADRVVLLSLGQKEFEGSVGELERSGALDRVYLGQSRPMDAR